MFARRWDRPASRWPISLMPLRRMCAAGVLGESLESGHAAVVEIACGLALLELAFNSGGCVLLYMTYPAVTDIKKDVWLSEECVFRGFRVSEPGSALASPSAPRSLLTDVPLPGLLRPVAL